MPDSSSRINTILEDIDRAEVIEFISNSILNNNFDSNKLDNIIDLNAKAKGLTENNIYYQIKNSFEELFN